MKDLHLSNNKENNIKHRKVQNFYTLKQILVGKLLQSLRTLKTLTLNKEI